MAFQGPLNLHVPRNKPGGRWGDRSLLPAYRVCKKPGKVRWGVGDSVEMANELVGKDRYVCTWRKLWPGIKSQSEGSKVRFGYADPGQQDPSFTPSHSHPLADSPSISRP